MTLRAQIVSLFLLILFITIAVSGVLQYLSAREAQLSDTYNELNAIAEAKKLRMDGIIRKRQEQIIMLQLRERIRENFLAVLRSEDATRKQELVKSLRETRNSIPSFRDIHLLSLQGRVVATSSADQNLSADFSGHESFKHALAGELCMHEFFYDRGNQLRIRLTGKMDYNAQDIGVAMIITDAEDILSIIEDYTGLGETGETTLARKNQAGDIEYLTPTRFYKNTRKALALPADTSRAMTKALEGREETLPHALDYRNKEVIAAPRHIQGTGWGIATKIDRQEALKPLRELLWRTLLLTLLLGIMVSVVAYYYANRILQPIITLCQVSWDIAKGNVEKRINYSKNNEVGRLAANFNLMADNLVAANRELALKLAELDRINESLNRFSYVVSHDLKSPLAALSSLINEIEDDLKRGEKADIQEMLDMANAKVQHMQQLISGILQFAMAGPGNQSRELVDLDALVHDIVQQLDAPENIKVVVNELPELAFEKVLITQVFQNLISNAIKFMDKEEGKIEVSYRKDKNQHLFTVTDNGSGIEEKYFGKIFQVFNKVNRKPGVESSGIGLSIVKKIVESSGGRVWVESEVGVGSRFYFALPIKP